MLNQLLFLFVAPQIWLQVLLTIVGIIVVLWGADRLTDGAVGLAERMGVPQIVIGLTIVAMGTSMPEFFVSFMSAINGTPDLAVGNVVGSNIFNALLIVGVAAMVSPIAILHDTVRKDIPFAIIASVVLMILCNDSGINRLDALIMLMMFIFYIITTLRGAKQEKTEESSLDSSTQSDKDSKKKQVGVGKALLLTVVGLASLILGSNVFVDNVSAIAATLGMSDALIGLTIVAMGTSLPELATSVVAARRGNSGIAIGNVIGSNVFNILMILGITGLIAPMQISGITFVDLSVMVLSMVLIWLVSFTRYRIERWEGLVLVTAFASYLSYLIVQAV
ncbi:MAG: calcium/sodium antiporter [Prevotella sp.]|nr:calcium/sodium antiporter [Prevotella sp.]